MLKAVRKFSLGIVAMAVLSGGSWAAESDAIRIVVPYAQGGPTDVIATPVARALAARLQRPVELDYRGGDGGTRGARESLQLGPDVLLLHNIGMASAPSLYKQLPFKPERDFEPIGLVGDAPMVLVARKGLHGASSGDLGRFFKEHEKHLLVAYGGPGGAGRLCAMQIEALLNVRLFAVPYTGTAPALADLVDQKADILCDQTTNTLPAIQSHKIQAMAVTTRQRVGILPNVSTMAERGLPTVSMTVWHGLYAPRGADPAMVKDVAAALSDVVENPEYVAALTSRGAVPATPSDATPAALRAKLKAEILRWRPLIVRSGDMVD